MATPLTTAYKRVDRRVRLRARRLPRRGGTQHRPRRLPARRRRPRERARLLRSTPPSDRRALQAELIHALTDGPGVVVFEDAFAPDVVDRASERVLRHHRGAARGGLRGGRPLRQAGRQRPHLERRAEARAARPRGVRRVLRQRHARRGLAGLARPALSGHLAGQRRQSRWQAAGSAPRLPPGLRRPRRAGGLPGASCTACRRC